MSATLSDLSPSAIKQIVAAIRESQKPQPTGLILTTAEAIAYVKKDSKSGFYAWAKLRRRTQRPRPLPDPPPRCRPSERGSGEVHPQGGLSHRTTHFPRLTPAPLNS